MCTSIWNSCFPVEDSFLIFIMFGSGVVVFLIIITLFYRLNTFLSCLIFLNVLTLVLFITLILFIIYITPIIYKIILFLFPKIGEALFELLFVEEEFDVSRVLKRRMVIGSIVCTVVLLSSVYYVVVVYYGLSQDQFYLDFKDYIWFIVLETRDSFGRIKNRIIKPLTKKGINLLLLIFKYFSKHITLLKDKILNIIDNYIESGAFHQLLRRISKDVKLFYEIISKGFFSQIFEIIYKFFQSIDDFYLSNNEEAAEERKVNEKKDKEVRGMVCFLLDYVKRDFMTFLRDIKLFLWKEITSIMHIMSYLRRNNYFTRKCKDWFRSICFYIKHVHISSIKSFLTFIQEFLRLKKIFFLIKTILVSLYDAFATVSAYLYVYIIAPRIISFCQSTYNNCCQFFRYLYNSLINSRSLLYVLLLFLVTFILIRLILGINEGGAYYFLSFYLAIVIIILFINVCFDIKSFVKNWKRENLLFKKAYFAIILILILGDFLILMVLVIFILISFYSLNFPLWFLSFLLKLSKVMDINSIMFLIFLLNIILILVIFFLEKDG